MFSFVLKIEEEKIGVEEGKETSFRNIFKHSQNLLLKFKLHGDVRN